MDTNELKIDTTSICAPKKFGIKLFVFGLTLGISLIGASALISYTIINLKSGDNIITVSGSAKEKVTADKARWSGRFSRVVIKENLKGGYEEMKNDEKVVKDFLTEQGFPDAEISPIFMNEMWSSERNSVTQYNLTQDIEVKTDDPQKAKTLAKNSEELANTGVLFQSNPVEYYYSKLPDKRISLLPEAIKDARARANIIAENSGSSVSTVKSVSMGVVQVLSEGSIDVSDYGTYDTSKIEKEVMVTVKTTFGLK